VEGVDKEAKGLKGSFEAGVGAAVAFGASVDEVVVDVKDGKLDSGFLNRLLALLVSDCDG
jgi:hypothetical protein